MSYSLFEEAEPQTKPLESQPQIELACESPVAACIPEDTEAVAEKADKPVSLPERVATDYLMGLAAAIDAIERMQASLRAHYGLGFQPFEEAHRKLPCVNQLNKEMYNTILAKAKQTGLAAPGQYSINGDFDLYLTGLNRHGGYVEENEVRVDIPGLCNAIFTAYGGDAGSKAEKYRIAKALISKFDLEKAQIEPKKGFVELSSHLYLEKRYNGKYEIPYSAKDGIEQALQNLAHVFHLSGMLLDMNSMRKELRDYGFSPEPNKTKFEGFIDDYPLTVKVYKGELRWKFAEQCIAVLSDFVSEFGNVD